MLGTPFFVERKIPGKKKKKGKDVYRPHFCYLQFIFYYLEEVMDYKKLNFFLLPLGSQYEINTKKLKVIFQNILGLAGSAPFVCH